MIITLGDLEWRYVSFKSFRSQRIIWTWCFPNYLNDGCLSKEDYVTLEVLFIFNEAEEEISVVYCVVVLFVRDI